MDFVLILSLLIFLFSSTGAGDEKVNPDFITNILTYLSKTSYKLDKQKTQDILSCHTFARMLPYMFQRS